MGAALEFRLLPLALLITLVTALVGVLLVRLLIPLTRWLTAVGITLSLALLAVLSGGLSLNDGSLALGPARACWDPCSALRSGPPED